MLSLYHTVLNTEVLVSQHVDASAVSALVWHNYNYIVSQLKLVFIFKVDVHDFQEGPLVWIVQGSQMCVLPK